jgi:hypothetical protein
MTVIAPLFGNTPHDVNSTTETGDIVASGGVFSVTTSGTISAISVFKDPALVGSAASPVLAAHA